MSLAYRTLNQTHPEYNLALLTELEDLYVGGYRILAKSGQYLTKMVGEHDERFRERCLISAYLPYFSNIVNQFASALFERPLDVKAAPDASNPDTPGELPDPTVYREFAKNCDRKGGTFPDLMKTVLITALTKRSAVVHLDAPAATEVPQTRAEEEDLGTDRVYAYDVPLEQMIDWQDGEDGLVWATLRTMSLPRNSPTADRDTVFETFKIWEMKDGVAVWKKYEVSYKLNSPKPNPDQAIPLVDEGTTSFKRIPLLKLTLPNGLWIGGLIGPQAREHYQRRSSLIGSENRSLCAIPWVKRGSEIGEAGGALPSETQQDPNRGANPVGMFVKQGWVGLGADDAIGFAEPQGHAYEIINKQINELKDCMYSVASQMASSISGSSTTALGRSGLSKQKDTESTAKVLGEFGAKIRQFAALIYRTISEARGEDVFWTAQGLDDYEQEDREQVLEEGVSLDQIAIPSITFRKHHKFQTARKILGHGVDPATLEQIKIEVEAGVEQEEEYRALMQDAQEEQLKNPLGAEPPTPPKNPTVLGMQTPGSGGPGGNTPPGGTPEPGGATKDGQVGQSKSAKMAGTPAPETMAAKPNGPGGQPLLPDNAHHQTGVHVDAKTVYEMLREDYKDKDIKWVLTASWVGPVEVPLASIDFSNSMNWQASEDADHVQDFSDILAEGGQLKPIILVGNPANDAKFIIVDGHHRGLASLQADVPVVAYVGQVGSDVGDWTKMHSSQKGKETSKQASKQKPQ